MPSTYSHYYFGCLVYERLSETKKEFIKENRLFFDAGQNGPDLLLYHSALKPSDISKQNHEIHQMSGTGFFQKINRESHLSLHHLAYVYGYICHFVLDAYLHPYVEQYKEDNQVSHMLIEREFERYLLEKNGLSPFKHSLTKHILLDKQLYEVMASFVSHATPKDMKITLRRMKKMYMLTKASNSVKRKLIYMWMDYHHKSYLKDFVFTKYADTRCEESNLHLEKMLNEAINIAVECINDFENQQLTHTIWERVFG